MRVPLEWLKQCVPTEATAEEIGVRLTMGGAEVEGIEESAVGPVLDVYITPNRGDCLSIVGVAREVAALYGLPLNAPSPPRSQNGGEAITLTSITLEAPQLCPRYAARIVRGIKVEPSPLWMQARLEALGQRPINNIVDVTNYVMLEMGQPLHAFDLDTLAEKRIVVRTAHDGETLRTLDGQNRDLTPSMLVIADAEKPIAVAGVMGGADTEVTEGTRDILLESAHFDALSVRRTSRALGLRTEASYRFERVVDPHGVVRALDRVCELLAQMGQPHAVEGVVDCYPAPALPKALTLRPARVRSLLGISDITAEVVAECLQRLGLEVAGTEESLSVLVPTFRADLALEEDLVEEVGRIYGYENIPETLPFGGTTRGGDSSEGTFLTQVRQVLAASGLQETLTHSLNAVSAFDDSHRVAVRNSLSAELSGLRRTMLPGLLGVAQANIARAGRHDMGLFETGHVWQNEVIAETRTPCETVSVAGLLMGDLGASGWQRDARPQSTDFGLLRGLIERLLEALSVPSAAFLPLGDHAEDYPQFHPGRTALLRLSPEHPDGILGELHPRLASQYGLRKRVYLFEIPLDALRYAAQKARRYQPLPSFPAATRDLAPRLPETVSYASIEAAVREAKVAFVESFRLTDVFQGEPLPSEVKSLTLSFTLRSGEGTLTEAQISGTMEQLREVLSNQCGATFVA